MKMLQLVALVALSACDNAKVNQNEFFVADALGQNASFLVERNSGCVWALVVERDTSPAKSEMTVEEFQQFMEQSDQYLDDAKKYGRYELVDIKSVKTEACQIAFGLTSIAKGKSK
jgi:hypothetical protein